MSMTLDELYSEISKDFDIDVTDLTREAAKGSSLFVKYIRLYSDESIKYELMENKRKELIIKKRDYYSGNGTPEEYKAKPFSLKLRTDTAINKYIESDPEVILYDQKVLIQKQRVSILKECMEEIRRRSFTIKNILDHQKFINGG